MARPQNPLLFPDLPNSRRATARLENRYREMGFARIAGVDEAGRGPLAGPVVAAAVVLPDHIAPDSPLAKVCDSKLATPEERSALYEVIAVSAVDLAWAFCDAEEIDRTNILAASLEAMRRAVQDLEPRPDLCLVDGRHGIPGRVPSAPVIKGDRLCLCIAAASIIAKVVRDRIMEEFHRRYPGYGFDLHKGYPTPEHKAALAALGPCPIHRKTFRGVKELCGGEGDD